MLQKAHRRSTLTVTTTTRKMVHLSVTIVTDDVVDFIEELLMVGGKNKTYTLGSGHLSSVLDVVEAVREYASYDINVVVNPRAAGDESEVDYMDGPKFVRTDVYSGEEQAINTVVERVYHARMSRRSRIF